MVVPCLRRLREVTWVCIGTFPVWHLYQWLAEDDEGHSCVCRWHQIWRDLINTLKGWTGIQRELEGLEKQAVRNPMRVNEGKRRVLQLGRNEPCNDRLGLPGWAKGPGGHSGPWAAKKSAAKCGGLLGCVSKSRVCRSKEVLIHLCVAPMRPERLCSQASLEVFKTQLDKALWKLVWAHSWPCFEQEMD